MNIYFQNLFRRNAGLFLRLPLAWKILILLSLLFAVVFLLLPIPSFDDNKYATVLESRDGTLLGARIAEDGQWRFPPGETIPEKFRQAILHFEDEYFYRHPGINPVSMAKALRDNVVEGKIKRGGSTISMQVVRLSRRNQPRTVKEKVLEVLIALKMELLLSKEEVLRLYAAHAPFGGNVVGLSAAAWRYYGRPQEKLSWAEAATLALLPNSPSLIYPGKNSKFLLAKRNRLLDKLKLKGIITSDICYLSKEEPLPGRPKPLPDIAAHLLNRAKKEGKSGQNIRTTINADLQQYVKDKVQQVHRKLKENYIHNIAAVVIEVETGSAIAYVGNADMEEGAIDHGQYVDIIAANRSTGSLLKPILYAAALEEGLIMPQQLLPDIPVYLQGFAPQNFDKLFHGAVHADKALIRSYNVPFVHLLKDYGYEKFHLKLRKMGLKALDKPAGYYGLSMILGGAESSLWEVTGVYASMVRSLLNYYKRPAGKQYSPSDYHPNDYLKKEREATATHYEDGLLSVGAIRHMLTAMQGLNRPEEQSGWEHYASSNAIAWKTGTSYGFKDAWAIGMNTKFVVGVWMGNADGEGRPELTGVKAAAPLLFTIFDELKSDKNFPLPQDMQNTFSYCSVSGYKAGPNCEDTKEVQLPVLAERAPLCYYHQLLHLDESEAFQVSSACYPVNKMKSRSWFVLPPAEAKYYKQYHANYTEPPDFLEGCRDGSAKNQHMELIYPRHYTRVYIPTELDGSPGSSVFEVAHRSPSAVVYWHLNEQYIGKTSHKHQMGINPERGNHKLHLVDDKGRELTLAFEVVSDRKE